MTKHIVAIIDRSGSMASIADDMNGGITSWLEGIVAADPEALLTSVLFDTEYDVTNNRTPLKDVKRSSLTIIPRGATALNDAIMKGLATIKKGEDALVLVVTDGQENSSTEVDTEKVKKQIAKLEKKGIVFQYLSASPTAFTDAQAYGFAAASTHVFRHSADGTRAATTTMAYVSDIYLGKNNTATTTGTAVAEEE